MLGKALVLPRMFLFSFCSCRSLDSVAGSSGGVAGDMGGCGGMAGCTCGKSSRSFIGATSSGMGDDRSGARITAPYFTPCPCSPCCNSFPWTVILRIFCLEVWEYMLGTVGSP
jgi:hypothetical protein